MIVRKTSITAIIEEAYCECGAAMEKSDQKLKMYRCVRCAKESFENTQFPRMVVRLTDGREGIVEFNSFRGKILRGEG